VGGLGRACVHGLNQKTPLQVHVLEEMLCRPFTSILIGLVQVARSPDPLHDAAVVHAVRAAVGPNVALRCDANQKWTLKQAVQVRLCIIAWMHQVLW
jgi:L-alanine-DL-glutamate epimerase-like enolase superfamily enzyme